MSVVTGIVLFAAPTQAAFGVLMRGAADLESSISEFNVSVDNIVAPNCVVYENTQALTLGGLQDSEWASLLRYIPQLISYFSNGNTAPRDTWHVSKKCSDISVWYIFDVSTVTIWKSSPTDSGWMTPILVDAGDNALVSMVRTLPVPAKLSWLREVIWKEETHQNTAGVPCLLNGGDTTECPLYQKRFIRYRDEDVGVVAAYETLSAIVAQHRQSVLAPLMYAAWREGEVAAWANGGDILGGCGNSPETTWQLSFSPVPSGQWNLVCHKTKKNIDLSKSWIKMTVSSKQCTKKIVNVTVEDGLSVWIGDREVIVEKISSNKNILVEYDNGKIRCTNTSGRTKLVMTVNPDELPPNKTTTGISDLPSIRIEGDITSTQDPIVTISLRPNQNYSLRVVLPAGSELDDWFCSAIDKSSIEWRCTTNSETHISEDLLFVFLKYVEIEVPSSSEKKEDTAEHP